MEPSFTSGEPGWRGRLARWVRTYRWPVTMTALFLAALFVFAVLPAPSRPQAESTPEPTAPPPDRSPCPACGIGERCDETTGECALTEQTPLTCQEGTEYDEDLGYCVPEPTPRPTAPPSRTLAPDALPTPSPPARTPEPTPSETEEPEEPEPTDDGSDSGDGSGSSPQPPRTPESG